MAEEKDALEQEPTDEAQADLQVPDEEADEVTGGAATRHGGSPDRGPQIVRHGG